MRRVNWITGCLLAGWAATAGGQPAEGLERLLVPGQLQVEGEFPDALHDSDEDGIVDIDDNCPDSPRLVPAEVGTLRVRVDHCGCVIHPCDIDDDGDGVPLCRDRCPGTWKEWRVDAIGCPAPIVETVRVTLDVKFAFARAEISPEFHDELARVAAVMRQFPALRVRFEGHTDSAGPAGYNLSLSRVRAQAARYYLFREFAIRPDRIEAVGYGESQPVADNGTEAGRRANRRTVAAFSVNREYVPDLSLIHI